jgi:hypothetical protein
MFNKSSRKNQRYWVIRVFVEKAIDEIFLFRNRGKKKKRNSHQKILWREKKGEKMLSFFFPPNLASWSKLGVLVS